MLRKARQTWPKQDQEIAEKMWKAGHSGTEIAKVLNRTRSAVLGFVSRNGWQKNLPKKTKPPKARKEKRVKIKVLLRNVLLPDSETTPMTKKMTAESRPWTTRKAFECQYPVSGRGADMFSCCQPIPTVFGYCAKHQKVMYVKPTRQRYAG